MYFIPLYLLTILITYVLSHLCLWFSVLWLLDPATPPPFPAVHSETYILPPLLFSSLLPFSLLMSKTLQTFPGIINVLLGLSLTLFFWRVNTKRKWRKSSYHCLPLDSISISVSLLFPLLRPLISTHPSSPLLFHPVSLFHSFILLYWKPAAVLVSGKPDNLPMKAVLWLWVWRKPHLCQNSESTTVLNRRTSVCLSYQILKQLLHLRVSEGGT